MALTREKLEYQRKWRKEHPEEYRQQQLRSRASVAQRMATDLDYFVDVYYKRLQNGAAARGHAFNLSKKQLRKIVEGATHCAISGRPLTRDRHCPNKISIDRIDNRFGYSVKNVQVVCASVNTHRMDATIEDFIKLAQDIAKYQRKNRA